MSNGTDPSRGRIWRRQTDRPDTYLNPQEIDAKGVAIHCLIVLSDDLNGQSVILYYDSHGQLDVIGEACPPESLPILCGLTWNVSCILTLDRRSLTLPPGFFQVLGIRQKVC